MAALSELHLTDGWWRWTPTTLTPPTYTYAAIQKLGPETPDAFCVLRALIHDHP